MGIRPALSILFALLLAAPAQAATQPFGGLEQRGCISEDGSGGRCADGHELAGVSSLTADSSSVYAVSPGALVVLDAADLSERACFSATVRAGCTYVAALAGASDVARGRDGVYVSARDTDAVAKFKYAQDGLAYAGCAAAVRADCSSAPALHAPRAVAASPFGDVWVVSSDSVAVLDPSSLQQRACFNSAGSGGCAAASGLDDPRDAATDGIHAFVASAGSNGVAFFDAQRPAFAGCTTEGGAGGCVAGTGLRGAARVAAFRDSVYAAAPGSGTATLLSLSSATLSPVAGYPAPTGALAIPPFTFVADAPSYAGSHVYAGGAGLTPFRRDRDTGRLTPMAGAAYAPSGAVGDLAVSSDVESTAVYAAVPSAGAVIAFIREIAPNCGPFFAPPPPAVVATADPTAVPLHCYDANRDPLSYAVVTPPARGQVVGFTASDALYRPPRSGGPGVVTFTVRASDGAESALARVEVRVSPPAPKPRLRILDRRVRMDRRGRMRVRLRCTAGVGKRCRTTLAAGRARRTTSLRSGRTTKVRVRLAKRLRRAVRSHPRRGVRVTLVAKARQSDGQQARATRKIRVRPPRSP